MHAEVSDGDSITAESLSERITAERALCVPLPEETRLRREVRLTFEREYVAEVLRQNRGNAAKTARVLGISRQMVQQKIKVYGLRARLQLSPPPAGGS